ncbi:MAG: helix-turn-helix domain-containing protein [Bacilli bacterium]|nr:helix-turn-helix domain-containing protein [Bacilli bacterium]
MNNSFDEEINPTYNPFRLIRIVKNLTGEEMAILLNCTNQYVSLLENGKRKLSDKALEEKLDCLGISMESYVNLYKFLLRLQKSSLDESTAYALALVRTIGTVYEDQREECNKLARIPRSKTNEKKKTLKRNYIDLFTIYR